MPKDLHKRTCAWKPYLDVNPRRVCAALSQLVGTHLRRVPGFSGETRIAPDPRAGLNSSLAPPPDRYRQAPARRVRRLRALPQRRRKRRGPTLRLLAQIVPKSPPYAILCNFDEFWIYDFTQQLYDPVDKIPLRELSERWSSLGFLLPTPRLPVTRLTERTDLLSPSIATTMVFSCWWEGCLPCNFLG